MVQRRYLSVLVCKQKNISHKTEFVNLETAGLKYLIKKHLSYKRMPDSVLFRVQKLRVPVREVDLPGPTRAIPLVMKRAPVERGA
jgi:hypothetical protein